MNTTLPTKLLAFVLSLMLPAVAAAQTSAFAPYYNKRGLAREAKGDHDGAVADYNRAIDLNPKDAGAYMNRGFAKQANGDVDGAIADFDRAIDLDPKQPRAYMNRGFAKQANGDQDGAIADYNRALELAAKLAKP
jgi:tetratricopeptide (TPR) repeat protein